MHNPTLRVIQVINTLCESDQPLRLSELSKELDVPKSTLLPILQTLHHHRYIGKDAHDRYYPATALIGAGAAAKALCFQEEEIRECLKQVVDRFGETCYYGVLEEDMVRYVEKIDSPQPLRMLTAIGHKLPAYATGLGKALLMAHTPQQLRTLYPEQLKPLTANTVTDVDVLIAQLQESRENGYSWEVEESTEHIRCFGVPIWQNGRIAGAISIAIPVFRFKPEMQEPVVEIMKQTAEKLSNILQTFAKGE